jgi:two-component system nitrogen regulation response regulator NtrX
LLSDNAKSTVLISGTLIEQRREQASQRDHQYEIQKISDIDVVQTRAKILVVDDDHATGQILAKILRGENHHATLSYSAQEAKARIDENPPDLILMDLQLPDIDGIKLAHNIIKSHPVIPIILVSAFATISKAVMATKMGVYDFLEKPFERDRLLLTIRNALSWRNAQQQQLDRLKHQTFACFKMVGQSPSIKQVFSLIERVSPLDSPVLILGENGVGKELVALAIHNNSTRANKPLVKINCPSIPETLIESELFGHKRGSFTGAAVDYSGRLYQADKGTLFLDEIGELSLSAQANLLRFLESGEIQRIGSSEIHIVNVRIIAATNRDLKKMVDKGDFRKDLYYRLCVFPIAIPPLRERRDDIPVLLNHFISEYTEKHGTLKPQLTQAARHQLYGYAWPGNVRQLQHFVERMMILYNEPVLDIEHIRHLLSDLQDPDQVSQGLVSLKKARETFERQYITTVLVETEGNVAKAAQILQVDRANLYRKLHHLKIDLWQKT